MEDDILDRLRDAAPLFDDEGLDEVEHCCEWTLQQDRKRLQPILQAAMEEITRLQEVTRE